MKTRQRGSVLVEFALVSPVMVGLLLAAMQFGYAFYTYNNLEKAVRDGCRYAATRTYQAGEVGDAAFKLAVRNVVVYGQPSPPAGANPIIYGLTDPTIVSVTSPTGGLTSCAAPGCTVTVAISSYQLPFGNITLSNKPWSTFLYYGRYVP